MTTVPHANYGVHSGARGARVARLLAGMLLTSCSIAEAQTAKGLQSFYVQSQIDGGQQIVEVSQAGRDVRVRTIRMAAADDQCPAVVVSAYDQMLPNTNVRKVAGTPLCGISERYFNRLVSESRETGKSYVDFFGWRGSVVASCSGKDRRFGFVQEAGDELDEHLLGLKDRDVLKVWSLTMRATDGTLVQRPDDMPGQQAREALGTTLVPELVRGKYETAFRDACWDSARKRSVRCEPNYFAWRLEGYTGPPAQRGPLPLQLVNHDAWRFVEYVPPVFPPIALSARVSGDVHLRLEVDPADGTVTRVAVVRSIPLLDAVALAAARKWRFVPGSTPGEPFEIALRFQVACPAP